MRAFARFAALLTLISAGSGILRADEPKPAASPLTAEDQAFFAWWDTLGYPDLAKLPFVEVATGLWSDSEMPGSDPEPMLEQGFLVAEEAKTFRVFLTDLRTLVLRPKTVPGKPWQDVRQSAADLASFVAAGLGRAGAPTDLTR